MANRTKSKNAGKNIPTNQLQLSLTEKPPLTEQTKAQIPETQNFSFTHNMFPPEGHGPPPYGSYDTFRRMKLHPVIALGTSIATAPILASSWDYVEKQNAPAGAVDLIRDMFEPLKSWLTWNSIQALIFGWAPFEKRWTEKDGKIIVDKLKPLLVDSTRILIDKSTGSFVGLSADNGATTLGIGKSFVYSHQMTCSDMFGFSRYMCVKDVWAKHNFTSQKCSEYLKKCAAVLFILHYPEGSSTDAQGRTITNLAAASQLSAQLGNANSIAMSNTLYPGMEAMLSSGASPEKLAAWRIELLETSSSHGQEFTSLMEYYDKLILRGLLVPESVALTGTHGNQATASEHADISLSIADQTVRELLLHVNQYITNQVLTLNYGPKAENTVCVVGEPIISDKKNLYKEIIRMLFSPQNTTMTAAWLDIGAMLESLGIPSQDKQLAANYMESYLIDQQQQSEIGNTGEPDVRARDNQEPNMERTGPLNG